jgi:ribose 5-phosphate isomerase A
MLMPFGWQLKTSGQPHYRSMNTKKLAAKTAVEFVKDGMTIGLGTGSTAYWAIQLIGEMVQQGLNIKAIPTSSLTEKLAKELNIAIASFSDVDEIDITIDGADEIDKSKNLIKGGGGALLREKIVAYNSKQFIVIADESKLVTTLGKFPLPVEIASFGASLTLKRLTKFCNANLRKNNGKPFLSDNGNYIVDCHFISIDDPALLDAQLKSIAGVMETGIFLKEKVNKVIIGYNSGDVQIL